MWNCKLTIREKRKGKENGKIILTISKELKVVKVKKLRKLPKEGNSNSITNGE